MFPIQMKYNKTQNAGYRLSLKRIGHSAWCVIPYTWLEIGIIFYEKSLGLTDLQTRICAWLFDCE